MHRSWLILTLAGLLTGFPASAGELSEALRPPVKEPAYQTKPKYCLLVFGPEAKTRIWLVLDGDVLYVDRNGNGDLTEADKRLTRTESSVEIGEIREAGGKTVHLLTACLKPAEKGGWEVGDISCTSAAPPLVRQTIVGRFRFADRPQDAPVVPFAGPLTLTPRRDRGVVREVGGPWLPGTDLHVLLGTPVQGK